jgi:hypothetical protein
MDAMDYVDGMDGMDEGRILFGRIVDRDRDDHGGEDEGGAAKKDELHRLLSAGPR